MDTDRTSNEAAPFLSDAALQREIAYQSQQDLAQRLGGSHMQHAEAAASATVLRQEVLNLRKQVLDGLELDLQRQGQIGRLQATVADLRQQLGLPPELEEEADELDDPHGPRRTDHRFADAHVAPHDRALDGAARPLADAPDHEEDAHEHGLTNAGLAAAMETARGIKGGELTAEEIAAVHAHVAGQAPGGLEAVAGRLA